MKFFRLDLLTLLISLFILNSCKNEDTIGITSGIGQLSGSLVDTATIFTNTALDDSVVTSSSTSDNPVRVHKMPLGYINDPIFGTTESSLITDLNLPYGGSYTIPAGTVTIDSALLILKYADGFYGDASTDYTFNVYQLNERQSAGQEYYNNKTWSYNANTVLGTKTLKPRPLDSILIKNLVAGGPDTMYKVPPQIRIPVSTNFIYQNVFANGAGVTEKNLVFKNNVKGFFVNIDKSKTTGTGGTLMLQAPADSSLAVYVRVTNGSVIDTSILYLDVQQRASQIKQSYSQQILKALNHTKPSDSLVYVQGLASLRTKVSFPYIHDLFKSIGNNNVVINRAELVLTVAPGTDIPAYLVPQPKLTLYKLDIAHQRTYIEDGNTGSAAFMGIGEFGGFYNLNTRSYHFLVTAYIQDLINNRTADYGTYISPVDTTATSGAVSHDQTIETAGRSVIVGGKDKTSPYRMKLNVIYTKIK